MTKLEPKAPECIDSSMLSDYMNCPSYFYLRHVLGLRRKMKESDLAVNDYFGWGGTWHLAQEVYAKNRNLGEAVEFLEKNFPPHIDPKRDKYKRSKDRMMRMMIEYDAQFRGTDEIYEILRTEQFFDVFFESYNFRWSGRIDQIRRNLVTGKILVWDFKTTSRMGVTYFPRLRRSFQFPGYVCAANEFTTEPVQNIMADVAYCITSKEEFYRQEFQYLPVEQEEWKANTLMIVEEMWDMLDRHLEEPEKWRKNYNDCNRFRECMFFPVHDTPPIGDTRLQILRSQYEVERWNPLDAAEDS